MKLSIIQQDTLEALKLGQRSAYPGLKIKTLEALKTKGLVKSIGGVGSMFSPTTSILWRLTEIGKAYLNFEIDKP